MGTNDLIKKMNKSRDVSPKQLQKGDSSVERLEADIIQKVEEVVEDLMVQKTLTEEDIDDTRIYEIKNEISNIKTTVNQMKVTFNRATETHRQINNKLDKLLQEIEEAKKKKPKSWKGLFS